MIRNIYRFLDNHTEITAQTPKGKVTVSKISHIDYDRVKNFHWCAITINGRVYLKTGMRDGQGKYSNIFLHRFILSFPTCDCVDHINNDPLDNRRENLREATTSENLRNTGAQKNNKLGAKGVSVRRGKFRVSIWRNGKSIDIGLFKTLNEAVTARSMAEIKYS